MMQNIKMPSMESILKGPIISYSDCPRGNNLQSVTNENLVDGSFDWPEIIRISKFAFGRCTNLTHITLPENITKIKLGTFSHCTNLTTVTFSDEIREIGEEAFYNCKKLTQITLPSDLKIIGRGAFQDCENLTRVIFGDKIKEIGVGAFQNCKNLTQLTLPPSVKIIKNGAFMDCTNLTHITLPNSIIEIHRFAFYNCSKLEFILISGTDEYYFNHIRRLLPDEFKNKVVSKCMDSVYKWQFYAKEALNGALVNDDVTSFVYRKALSFFKPETDNALREKNEVVLSNTSPFD